MKIAACIPTYRHSEVIKDVLQKSIKNYYDCGIDIYYFDSSEDDETEKVVSSYREQGFDNLYYEKLSSEYDPAKKIELIFRGGIDGNLKKYDYIWPVKDRSYCPKETLLEIVNQIEEQSDIMVLGGLTEISRHLLYDKADKFYKDWGWIVTSLDITIYKQSSMLKDCNMELDELSGLEYMKSWIQYVFLFRKLEKLDKKRIIVLCDNIWVYNSDLGESSWLNSDKVWKVAKDYWIEANENLPDCYNEYKNTVIKQFTMLPWILGGRTRLMELHQKGILTPESYESVLVNWNKVSDIPIMTVYEIAHGMYDPAHDLGAADCMKGDKTIDILIKITEMIKKGKISKEQIPFDDIEMCINADLIEKERYPADVLNLISGSVNDIKAYIMRDGTDREGVCHAMQLLVDFTLLAKS